MKILFLTFYYEPDLCAGSFRNTALAKKISSRLSEGDEIEVITTIPNRYRSFQREAKKRESSGHMTINRIVIPGHKNSFIGQIKSFGFFYKSAIQLSRNKDYDMVFASSSRLFTAFLGARIASRKKLPLYLDIRDIFVDTLNDVIKNRILKFFMLPVLKQIEKYSFTRAAHINLVSEGFKEYFKKFNPKSISYYTNGIDDEFLDMKDSSARGEKFRTILYAGNIGEGQGLDKIIPEAAELLGMDYKLIVIGDGGTRKKLEQEIIARKLQNIELLLPVGRKQLMKYYEKADFLFIHLNSYEAFKKVLPSKIFEYGAFDKPIIAGLTGFSRKFMQENIENCILFDPGDVEHMISQMKSYKYINIRRLKFIEEFRRDAIMSRMSDSILSICAKN